MVHGVGGTRWEWVESMAALASSHRALAPDLIGFGDSPRPDVIYSPAYLGEFLVAFLDAVGIDRVTLIGHSLGGRVCLEAAIRAPDAVEGLALIAPLGFGRLSRIGRLLSAWRVVGKSSPETQTAVSQIGRPRRRAGHERILRCSNATLC